MYRSYEVCCLYGCFVYHILSYFFCSILYHCIYGCMVCMLLFNIVNYVFLLLYMFRSGYSVSLFCSVYCLCVNVYSTSVTGCQPNCSQQIYQISKSRITHWNQPYSHKISLCETHVAFLSLQALYWVKHMPMLQKVNRNSVGCSPF